MIQIRPANPSDATALQELFQRFVLEANWLPESAKQDLDFAKASQGEKVFVAETSTREIVGLMSVWEPDGFVHTLYVSAPHQRKGIGTQLLESLERWLPRPWRLKCVVANQVAISFYRLHGWMPIETSTGEHGPYFLLEKQ
ncbi:GNAT family N-acetyltransferase [Blastopirellula marina]|uniref:N-acetyltransferase n=1 Tax=Blastopirellula marina TaxID=124 RepID=A0A2S8G9H9_9BACT|nr:GNAT family N-acetyltransferase [Blastopirellula marina]PQO41118.1 N-acetyltransferase [Blastopirellula marina]PTL45994.1 N-acetyltransferase [Blastopirellula marina]